MTNTLESIINANTEYSKHYHKGNSNHGHGAKFAIVTCMDERLDPVKFAGLNSNAHVIRNAGGRVTDDVIRSLIISHKLLGTQEWYIIQHTDCGGQSFTNDIITDLLAESLETSEKNDDGWYNPVKEGGSTAGQYINFMPIKNLEKSVIDDVTRLKNHPLVPSNIPIYGYIFDVDSGELLEVKKATEIGTKIE